MFTVTMRRKIGHKVSDTYKCNKVEFIHMEDSPLLCKLWSEDADSQEQIFIVEANSIDSIVENFQLQLKKL